MAATVRPDSDRIKSLRILRGWPQEQLARIADVSPRTIQRLEAGGNASFDTLRAIAGAFDVEVQDLFRQSDQATEPLPVRECPPPLQVQARNDRTSVLRRCLPYAPLIRMTAGTLALAMLASAAIRLSPFLMEFLDEPAPISASVASVPPDVPNTPGAPVIGKTQGVAVDRRVSVPAAGASSRANTQATSGGNTTRENIARTDSPSLTDSYTILVHGGRAQASERTTLVDALAAASALGTVPRGTAFEISETFGAIRSPSLVYPRAGALLPASSVSGAPDEGRGPVMRSFVRSGKVAASFLTKAGDSVRRVF